jgi:hypothetical protein
LPLTRQWITTSPPQGMFTLCRHPWLPTCTERNPQWTENVPGDSPTMCLSTQMRWPLCKGPTVIVPIVPDGAGVLVDAGADGVDTATGGGDGGGALTVGGAGAGAGADVAGLELALMLEEPGGT